MPISETPIQSNFLLQLFMVEEQKEKKVEVLYGWCLPVSKTRDNTVSKPKFSSGENGLRYRFRESCTYLSSSNCERLFAYPSMAESDLVNFLQGAGAKLCPQGSPRCSWHRRPDIWLPAEKRQAFFTPPCDGIGIRCSALFRLDKRLLLSWIPVENTLSYLQERTGIRFDGADAGRLGNIEKLIPVNACSVRTSLRKVEGDPQSLTPNTLWVKIAADSFPGIEHFTIRVRLCNAGGCTYDSCRELDRESLVQQVGFTANEPISEFEIQLHGRGNGQAKTERDLLYEERRSLCRTITTGISVVERNMRIGGDVKLDKVNEVNRKLTDTVEGLRSSEIKQKVSESRQVDKDDVWFDAVGSAQENLNARMPGPQSEGHFFQKGWGNEEYLAFRVWLKALIDSLPDACEVYLVDPYFDQVGLGILLQLNDYGHEYHVFMNSHKISGSADWQTQFKHSLQQNAVLLNCRNLHIRDCQHKDIFHDRYLLFKGKDTAKGFHLSNSLQKACENYPLLVTPIPRDVLDDVFHWFHGLIESKDLQTLWPQEKPIDSDEFTCRDEGETHPEENIEQLIERLTTTTVPEYWPAICSKAYRSCSDEFYLRDNLNRLGAIISPLAQYLRTLILRAPQSVPRDMLDLRLADYFRKETFEDLIGHFRREHVGREPRCEAQIVWGLRALLCNNIEEAERLIQALDPQPHARYLRVMLCIACDDFSPPATIPQLLKSRLPILRLVGAERAFALVRAHDNKQVGARPEQFCRHLRLLPPDDETLFACHALSFLWSDSGALGMAKSDGQKIRKKLTRRVQELLPKELSKDRLSTMIRLCHGPLIGTHSVAITDELLVPMSENRPGLSVMSEEILFDFWLQSANGHADVHTIDQQNKALERFAKGKNMTEWPELLKKSIRQSLSIVAHPLAECVDYDSASKARDTLLKSATLLLVLKTPQDSNVSIADLAGDELAQDVLLFADEVCRRPGRFGKDQWMQYYESLYYWYYNWGRIGLSCC